MEFMALKSIIVNNRAYAGCSLMSDWLSQRNCFGNYMQVFEANP